MARIQILQLPPYDRDGESPFALIVDQCAPPRRVVGVLPGEPEHIRSFQPTAVPVDASPVEFSDEWKEFGKQIGARSVLVTDETVEIVDDATEDAPLVEFDHAALMETVKTAVRVHLESSEASDAFRADMKRRAATARVGR